VVTRTTSTGVPAGTAGLELEPQVKETVADWPGLMGDCDIVMLLVLLHNNVPLVNSSSPRVIEVEGLSGGL